MVPKRVEKRLAKSELGIENILTSALLKSVTLLKREHAVTWTTKKTNISLPHILHDLI